MAKSDHDEKSSGMGCCGRCMETILCSCYGCMARMVAKLMMCVLLIFLVFFAYIRFIERKEPMPALKETGIRMVQLINPTF